MSTTTAPINAIAGLKKKAATKEKAEKPILPDPTGELAKAVSQAIVAKQQVDAFKLSLEQNQEVLTSACLKHFFAIYQGRVGEVEDTFQVKAGGNHAVIMMKNDYRIKDPEPVRAVLGEHADTFLVKRNIIEINADAIPPAVANAFITELIKLAKDMDSILGADEEGPVFNAISVTETTKLDKSFHTARHSLFTPEQNATIHSVIPCVTSVRLHY